MHIVLRQMSTISQPCWITISYDYPQYLLISTRLDHVYIYIYIKIHVLKRCPYIQREREIWMYPCVYIYIYSLSIYLFIHDIIYIYIQILWRSLSPPLNFYIWLLKSLQPRWLSVLPPARTTAAPQWNPPPGRPLRACWPQMGWSVEVFTILWIDGQMDIDNIDIDRLVQIRPYSHLMISLDWIRLIDWERERLREREREKKKRKKERKE